MGRRLALFGQREDVTRVPLLAEGEAFGGDAVAPAVRAAAKGDDQRLPVLTRASRAAAISASDPESWNATASF